MISGWNYGLVEEPIEISPTETNRRLLLCEVYYDKDDKLLFYSYVDWADITEEDQTKITEDLTNQMKSQEYYFKAEDFNYD